MPFLTVLSDPEIIETDYRFKKIYNSLNFESRHSFLLFLGFFALLMLLLSVLVRSITSYAKFRFSNLRRYSIGQRLLKKYLTQEYFESDG